MANVYSATSTKDCPHHAFLKRNELFHVLLSTLQLLFWAFVDLGTQLSLSILCRKDQRNEKFLNQYFYIVTSIVIVTDDNSPSFPFWLVHARHILFSFNYFPQPHTSWRRQGNPTPALSGWLSDNHLHCSIMYRQDLPKALFRQPLAIPRFLTFGHTEERGSSHLVSSYFTAQLTGQARGTGNN